MGLFILFIIVLLAIGVFGKTATCSYYSHKTTYKFNIHVHCISLFSDQEFILIIDGILITVTSALSTGSPNEHSQCKSMGGLII